MSDTVLTDTPEQQLAKRDRLLRTVNDAATVLLTAEEEKNFEKALLHGMELIGHCLEVDRVQIWRNDMADGALYFVHTYEWLSDIGRQKIPVPLGLRFPYSAKPEWERKFARGEYLNGPLSTLPPDDQEMLRPYDIQSLIIIPLFLHDVFWGFFSIDDCRQERFFGEDEIDILRSASLMMASAVKRHDQELKIGEAHERARKLLDAAPLACMLWDREGKLFECNEECVKLFKTKDKWEFIESFSGFSPEYQPDGKLSAGECVWYVRKALEDGRFEEKWMHQLRDGTPIPMHITLVRIEYGDDYFVAAYAQDLREHRQMMEEIEQRGMLLSTLNRVAAILLKSESGKFESSLNRCMKIIGQAVGADRIAVWKNHVKDGRLHCAQLYKWRDGNVGHGIGGEIAVDVSYDDHFPSWETVLSRRKSINSLTRNLSPREQAQLTPEGILSIFVAPVFIRSQFWGFVSFSSCHRELKFSADKELILRSASLMIANSLRRNDDLTEMLRLQSELAAALEDAQQTTEAKSSFLAHMSHEMRTPLNAIIGLSELAMETVEAKGEEPSDLEKIYGAGMTLLSTVNDILDISKIEAGRFEIVPCEYDLPSLLNDAVTQNVLRIGEKPIAFDLNIDGNLPARLYGDELRIKQVINNLLSNAFKYTKEGTVEMGVSCAQKDDATWMSFRIRDTGIGIRAADMGKLFSEYTRLDMRTNRGIRGTGLGLAIAKRIVELMGGSITVESEYGKGSVFTVRFPQKVVTDAVIPQDIVENLKKFSYSDRKRHQYSQMTRIRLPYARVLVVDDVVTNLDVAKGMMKPYGMQIDCVTSGQQAIDAIRAEKVRYNAVFMDHMMPGMDGIEATELIRKIGGEYAKNIPIIALTANAIAGNEEMFLHKGFQAFISKPIELVRLDAVIRQWVRDKELEKTLPDQKVLAGDKIILDIRSGRDRRMVPNRRSGIERRGRRATIPGLHMNEGIERFGGDEEAYLQVLHSYAANTAQLLEALRKTDRDNLADYAITVHGIKGSSRSIGASIVGDQAEALEKAAKAGDLAFVLANNAAFIDTASTLISGLSELLRQMSSEHPKPKKDKPDEEVLARLFAACEHYDMDGVDAAMTEIERNEYEADSEFTAWLRENVEQMNFAQIKEKLVSMIK